MPLTIPQYIEVKTAAGALAAVLSPEADGLKDCWIDNELNSKCILELSLPMDSTKWQYINNLYRIYAGGKEFAILNPDAIEVQRDGKKKWGKITTHESWVLLGKKYVTVSNDPQLPEPPELSVTIVSGGDPYSGCDAGSAKSALAYVLEGSGWSVGTVDVIGTHDLETDKESVLSNINKIQATWGGYLVWDSLNYTVSLRDETTWLPYTGYQVRYAKNLKNVTRKDDYDIVTKLYPFGEDDLDISTVNGGNKYIENYSYTDEVLVGTWLNPDISDVQELKDKSEEYLAKICQPRHNYQISQVDLRTLAGYQHEDYSLGHMVDLIDEELNVEAQVRIIRYCYNVFQPWQSDLEIGDAIEKIESMISESKQTAKFINSIKTSRGQISGYNLVDQSLITQKIAVAAIDASKLNTKTIILLGDEWTDNNPEAGKISWNQHKLYYSGTEYVINAGNTSQKYIYWDGTSNSYTAGDELPDLSDGQFYVAVNNSGIHDLVWNSSAAREFIGSLFIADAAIKTAHIEDLAVTNAKISELTANKIASGQLLTYLVNILGENYYFKITGDGLRAYSNDGSLMCHLGHYESLGDKVAAFTRPSLANLQNGATVFLHSPRYEYTCNPAPFWKDTFDTDDLQEYTAGGDTAGTWAIAGGVLSGSGGTQATLIKNDLLIPNCEFEVTCDQAHDGGIIVCYQDINNYYLLALRDDSGADTKKLQLLKRVGGTFTELGYASPSWPRGTARTIKLAVRGSILEIWFNDVKLFTAGDTALSGGGVGFLNNASTPCRFLGAQVCEVKSGLMMEEGTVNSITDPFVTSALPKLDDYNAVAYMSGAQVDGLMRLTTSADTGQSYRYYRMGSADLNGLVAGGTYTFSCLVFVPVDSTIDLSKLSLWITDHNSTGYLSSTGSTPTEKGVWQKITVTRTIREDADQAYVRIMLNQDVQNQIFYCDALQLENKAYNTVPVAGTRGIETLSIPTEDVLNKNVWTIHFVYEPVDKPNNGNIKVLWHVHIDDDNQYICYIYGDGRPVLQTKSAGTVVHTYHASDPVLEIGMSYDFVCKCDGTNLSFLINGVKSASGDKAYTEPAGSMPENMYLGCQANETNQANGIISDFSISSIARSDASILSLFSTGKSWPMDSYITYKMSLENTLQPTVRRHGLWANNGELTLNAPPVEGGLRIYDNSGNLRVHGGQYAPGEYGLKIHQGAVYGTTIRTGNEDSKTYIELGSSNTLTVWAEVDEVSQKQLMIGAVPGGGQIEIYDDGTMIGAIRVLGLEGDTYLALSSESGYGVMLSSSSSSMPIQLNGDVVVRGDLTANSKNNIEETEHYGRRALVVRESPEHRYIDEAIGELSNGECIVWLDPVFLECVEPDTIHTPWLIQLTSYVNTSVYVEEISRDFFVVKASAGSSVDGKFAWKLSGIRKGYAGRRLDEAKN